MPRERWYNHRIAPGERKISRTVLSTPPQLKRSTSSAPCEPPPNPDPGKLLFPYGLQIGPQLNLESSATPRPYKQLPPPRSPGFIMAQVGTSTLSARGSVSGLHLPKPKKEDTSRYCSYGCGERFPDFRSFRTHLGQCKSRVDGGFIACTCTRIPHSNKDEHWRTACPSNPFRERPCVFRCGFVSKDQGSLERHELLCLERSGTDKTRGSTTKVTR